MIVLFFDYNFVLHYNFTSFSLCSTEALLCRYLVCSKDWESEARKQFLRNKVNCLGMVDFLTNNERFLGMESDYKTASDEDVKGGYTLCPTYALNVIEPEETRGISCVHLILRTDKLTGSKANDVIRNMYFYFLVHILSAMDDPFCVDRRTGITLMCLSFLISHIFPDCLFLYTCPTYRRSEIEIEGTLFRYLGSIASKTNIFLKNVVPRLLSTRENEPLKELGATVVAIKGDTARYSISQDTSATYPGYVRLKIPSSSNDFLPRNIYREEGNTYLRKMEVSDKTALPRDTKRCLVGFDCREFPPSAQEWINRERKFQWPSRTIVDMIQVSGCTIISKHHPSSSNPDIEWKYDFSLSEVILFERTVTRSQMYGFYVIKVLLEYCTAHLQRKLKPKHIRAVFLNCCEQIPTDAWDANLGGCILQLVSYTIECLQRKKLPHYFISKRNMLHGFNEDELRDICLQVEALRLFPLQTMVLIAENRGLSYASNLTVAILRDCARFALPAELWPLYQEIFIPNTIKTVKFLARRGLYETAFSLLSSTLYIARILSTTMASSCSLAELFVSALSELCQETSKVILAMRFETLYGEHILDSLIKKDRIFLKDVLPWGISDNIAWLRVPEDKMENYELLAEYLLEFGKTEMKNLNTNLAELLFSEAIRCLEKNIEDTPKLDVSNIEDDMLKLDIQTQESNILRKVRETLKDCYTQMYFISQVHRLFNPLEGYMPAIEELCKELPEMSSIVSRMFGFLHVPAKQKEYAELYEIFLGTGIHWYFILNVFLKFIYINQGILIRGK